jgi:hypothetical protein
VTRSAPRIDPRLRAGIERIAREQHSIAETCRQVGALATELGLIRPSYEQIRVLVHEHTRRGLVPSTGEVLLDIAARARPAEALIQHVAGTLAPKRAK